MVEGTHKTLSSPSRITRNKTKNHVFMLIYTFKRSKFKMRKMGFKYENQVTVRKWLWLLSLQATLEVMIRVSVSIKDGIPERESSMKKRHRAVCACSYCLRYTVLCVSADTYNTTPCN